MTQPVIFGDWGTSRLRLFRSDQSGSRIGPGIGACPAGKLDALRETLGDWGEPHPLVVMCGMVGSRLGVLEVPYAPCPADQAAWARGGDVIFPQDFTLAIAAGLSCRNFNGAPDVMRGEETQIFGAMARDPALAQGRHLLILPGTHSKWARIEDGSVVAFHSFPTGEMFALLRDQSTLTRVDPGPDGEAAGFAHGIARAQSTPGLGAALFESRAAALLERRSRDWAIGFLSGLLIGRELVEGLALCGEATAHLIGDPALTHRYQQAGAAVGLTCTTLDGDQCAIAGLRAFHQRIVRQHTANGA